MAHKKGAGSTKNGRDSNACRLGVKVYGGADVVAGSRVKLPIHMGSMTKVKPDTSKLKNWLKKQYFIQIFLLIINLIIL